MASYQASYSLLEDIVECRLYPATTDDVKLKQELLVCAMKYSEFLKKLTCDYIWYHEELRVSASPTDVIINVNFRDGIEDEWYIVSLMCQLTEHFRDVVVSIRDGDGEFLLIEAANHLPTWLKPETSTNRVFIHQGDVHIIPQPSNPAEIVHYPVGTPTLPQAISLVRSDTPTVASKPTQEAIQRKIKQQPPKHFTHCYVPLSVAHLLHHNKQLVAASIHALCDRDQIDMKACRKMKMFPVEKCIMTGVTFTRRLYAQLLREQFQPPIKAGFHLYGNSVAHELGMKLTCGFEILLSQHNKGDISNCQSDPHWEHFIFSLRDKGYFQGELEGSRLHKELMEKAKQFYTEAVLQDDCGTRQIYVNEVHHLISEVPVDQLEQCDLPPADDDKWLEITPAELDHMIEQVQGIKLTKQAGLESVVDGMTSFIDHVSSYEGVELPWSLPDSQVFEVVASRDLFSSLQYKLGTKTKCDTENSSEQLIVEIISDVLKTAIADGLNRFDVIAFYHVMVEALDCCAKFDNTDDAVVHFTPIMARMQFSVPHATALVEHHVITIFQHFYLYHHVMTEVQEVDASNTLVTCHTPTRHPILKEAMQEDDWNRLSQINGLEKSYAEKRKELEEANRTVSCDPILESCDQVLTRKEVDQVTKQLLGNIIDMTKRNIEQNIKGQELTIDLASEKIKVLTNRQQPNSLPPSRKSVNT